MKRFIKRCGVLLCVAVFAVSLASCGQNKVVTSVAQKTDTDPVSVVRNIKTTQYFTDEAVAQKDMEVIVQAGINAPSAMNGQPWHFSVITDGEVLQKISEGMGFGSRPEGMQPPEGVAPDGMEFPGMPEGMDFPEMPEGMEFPEGQPPAAPGGANMNKAGITDAPLVIVISCKPGSELDAGLACQNMSAVAQLMGYGTKIVTSPTMALNGADQTSYQELLGIPEEYSAAAILLIGHEDTSADKNVDGYTGATTRNAVNDMVTYITAN